MKPCEWCGDPTGEVIFVELRRSTFSTNTPAGKQSVKVSRTVPCCTVCKATKVRAPVDTIPERKGPIDGQIDLLEMLEIVRKEGL